MVPMRQNFDYKSLSTGDRPIKYKEDEKEIMRVCPHCGSDLEHDPHDTFDFLAKEVIAKSKHEPGILWRRHVPQKAWDILQLLLRNIGKYQTTERIWSACFDLEVDTGSVTVQIGVLRALLRNTYYVIESRYGMGYRLLRINGHSVEEVLNNVPAD